MRIALFAVGAVAAVCLYVSLPKPPPQPSVVILPPTPLPMRGGRIPDRWIPPNWVWLRDLCQAIMGRPRQLRMAMEIIQSTNTLDGLTAEAVLGSPSALSNGVAAWLIADGRPPRSKIFYTKMGSALQTFDQMPATVKMIDTNASFSEEVFGHAGDRNVDLSFRVLSLTGGFTNFVARARVQLPYGAALYVVDARSPGLQTNRTGFFITADELDAHGNKITH